MIINSIDDLLWLRLSQIVFPNQDLMTLNKLQKLVYNEGSKFKREILMVSIDGLIRWQSRSLQWKTRPIRHVPILDWPIRNSHRSIEPDRTVSLPCCASGDLSPWQSVALNSLEIRQSDVWVILRQRERCWSSGDSDHDFADRRSIEIDQLPTFTHGVHGEMPLRQRTVADRQLLLSAETDSSERWRKLLHRILSGGTDEIQWQWYWEFTRTIVRCQSTRCSHRGQFFTDRVAFTDVLGILGSHSRSFGYRHECGHGECGFVPGEARWSGTSGNPLRSSEGKRCSDKRRTFEHSLFLFRELDKLVRSTIVFCPKRFARWFRRTQLRQWMSWPVLVHSLLVCRRRRPSSIESRVLSTLYWTSTSTSNCSNLNSTNAPMKSSRNSLCYHLHTRRSINV